MSDWRVFYRDTHDQDRISKAVSSREDALCEAKVLHRDRRAEIYRIEGPAGMIIPKEDVLRWVSENKW